MLLSFRVANHKSIRNEQVKSVLSQKEPRLLFRHGGESAPFVLNDEPRGTQIWPCYLPPVEILGRDEVWFVEKNQKQATELFSLADFKPRQDDNIQRRYLTGSYGAIPQPAEPRFGDAVRGRPA